MNPPAFDALPQAPQGGGSSERWLRLELAEVGDASGKATNLKKGSCASALLWLEDPARSLFCSFR